MPSGYPALTPTTGGRSIGPQAVKSGDIIVTTTGKTPAAIIRAVTSGSVSHIMVSVGNNKIVEAVTDDGVREIVLDKALDDATLAVAFRRRSITDNAIKTITANIRSDIGKKYNYWGVITTLLAENIGSIFRVPLSTDRFYCSQLILTAFASTTFPLLARGNVSAWPTNIVSFDDFGGNLLQYVGHLKA